MLTAILLLLISFAILKILFKVIGFICRASFWFLIGIPVALFFFGFGLAALGGLLLLGACAGGVVSLIRG